MESENLTFKQKVGKSEKVECVQYLLKSRSTITMYRTIINLVIANEIRIAIRRPIRMMSNTIYS